MRKRLEVLTPRDIRNFKRDIEICQKRKKIFLVIGIILLILFLIGVAGTILLGIGVYKEIKDGDPSAAYFLYILFDSLVGSLTVLCFIGMVAMFVLRGVLLDKQIEKRKRLIEDYEDLHRGEEAA